MTGKTKHKNAWRGVAPPEYDPTICDLCHLPLEMGRHRFHVVFGENDVIACDPSGRGDDEVVELRRENAMLKEILIAVMDDDPEGLDKILKREEKYKQCQKVLFGKERWIVEDDFT